MSEAGDLPDLSARRRALLDHGTTLLVEAGAGSGKTALMAGRVALLLAAGIPPREIVAITFTEAAASELRERIEGFVNRLAQADIPDELQVALPDGLSAEQSAAISAADETLDELTCTTIHGFCQQLVKPYPVEAGSIRGPRSSTRRRPTLPIRTWCKRGCQRALGAIEVPRASAGYRHCRHSARRTSSQNCWWVSPTRS